jgi:hypothetical protein
MVEVNENLTLTGQKELTESDLTEVSGAAANVILGIVAGIYGNAVYDALMGRRNGVFSEIGDKLKTMF